MSINRDENRNTYEVLTRNPPRGFLADCKFEGVAARELRREDEASNLAWNDAAVGEIESSTSS